MGQNHQLSCLTQNRLIQVIRQCALQKSPSQVLLGQQPAQTAQRKRAWNANCVQTLFSVQPIERRILFAGKHRCENLTRLHSSFWGIWPEIVSLNGVLSSAHLPMQVKYTRRSVGRKRIRRIFTKNSRGVPGAYCPVGRLMS